MNKNSRLAPLSVNVPIKPLALAVIIAGTVPTPAAANVEFLLPPNDSSSRAFALSGDGTTVGVNNTIYKDGTYTPVSVPEGYNNLYDIWSISSDGNVWVGQLNTGEDTRFAVWKNNEVIKEFDSNTYIARYGNSISDDGNLILIQVSSGTGSTHHLFDIDANQVQATIAKPEGTGSFVSLALSGDGTTAVGYLGLNGSPSLPDYRAFRWTDAGGVENLGVSDGFLSSSAHAVNRDGSIVVGTQWLADNAGSRAFRWSESTGIVSLGTLNDRSSSWANDVSADGAVIVGTAREVNDSIAFRWTEATGMISVEQWLTNAGVALDTSKYTVVMKEAYQVSDNGEVVLGYTDSSETEGDESTYVAVLARVSPDGSGVVNLADYSYSVQETGAQALLGSTAITDIIMFGAHHRSVMDNGFAANSYDTSCFWATGDHGENNEARSKTSLAEVGLCQDFGTTRIGLSVGKAWTEQTLGLGGTGDYDGSFVTVEAAHRFNNGLQPSILAMYGQYDLEMIRRYDNGGVLDTSTGTTDLASRALRLRADWKDLLTLNKVSISPYAAYTWSESDVESYIELGGGFPAQYDRNEWRTSDIRIGAAAEYALTERSHFNFMLETIRRLDRDTNQTSGEILGLGGFNVEGVAIERTWTRALVDLDYSLNKSTLFSLGANFSSSGAEDAWGITAGLKFQF